MKSPPGREYAIEFDNFLIVNSIVLLVKGRDSIIVDNRLVDQRSHYLNLLTTGNHFHQITTTEQTEFIISELIIVEEEEEDYLDLQEEIINGLLFMVFRLAIIIFKPPR